MCGDFKLKLLSVHGIQNSASTLYNDVLAKKLLPAIYRMTRIASSSCTPNDNMLLKKLLPTISRMTCIASSSCTPNDNMLLKKLNSFNSGIFTIDITDHFPFLKNTLTLISYLLSKFAIDL